MPPALAESRHLGLDGELEDLRRCRRELEAQRCKGLSDLEFQPVCACGFDGSSAPIEESLQRCLELRQRIETGLRLFFQQDRVRERIRGWNEQGEPQIVCD